MTEIELRKKICGAITKNEECAEALLQAVIDNGLDTFAAIDSYAQYSEERKGCNPQNPFIINETRGFYISLERWLLDYLLGLWGVEGIEHRIVSQALTREEDRSLDRIVVEVTPFEYAHNTYTRFPSHEEVFWFDITAGMKRKG